MMTGLSLAAYYGVIFFAARAAGAMPGAKASRHGSRAVSWCACALLFTVFLFLPPGSLPPFCDTPWGGVAFILCFALAQASLFRMAAFGSFMVLCLTHVALSWFVWQRGVPGSANSLGTFAAMPVWSIGDMSDMAAFAFLAVGLFLASGVPAPVRGSQARAGRPSLAERLSALAASAIFVVYFLPLNVAPLVSWSAPFAAGADFVFFWLKVFIVLFCRRIFGFYSRQRHVAVICTVIGAAVLFTGNR